MVNKMVFYRNVYRMLFIVWRHRYAILLPTLCMPVIAVALSLVSPKQYLSHTTFLLQETTKLNPFLEDFSVSTQLKERIAGLKALLHSRHMLLAVADDLGMTDENDVKPGLDAVNKLSAGLSVRLIGSDMIELSYRDNDPQGMATVLNAVTTHFLRNLLAPERSSVNASENFLQEQLALQGASLLSAEEALAVFKASNADRLPDQYQFDVQQMRNAEADLREKETELAGALAKTESLKKQLLKTNPMLSRIEENLVQLGSELSVLRARYTERHSKVISVSREMKQLKIERDSVLASTQEITELDLQQLWNLASELIPSDQSISVRPLLISQLESLEEANASEKQLQQEIKQLKIVISRLNLKLESFAGVEQQLQVLERDIQTKQTLYNDFLKRYELAKVTGALGRYEEGDRVKVIDQPFEPRHPMNPSGFVYAIAGFVGGAILGIGIVSMFEISNTHVVSREQLEQLTAFPVLTRIPKVEKVTLAGVEHESNHYALNGGL